MSEYYINFMNEVNKTLAECTEAFNKEVAKCEKKNAKEEAKEAKKKAKKEAKEAKKEAKKKAKLQEKEEKMNKLNQDSIMAPAVIEDEVNKTLAECTEAFNKEVAKCEKKNAKEEAKEAKKKLEKKKRKAELIDAVIEDEDDAIIDAVIKDESSSTDSDSDTNVVEVKEEKMESLLDIVQENISKKMRKKINRILSKYLPQNIKRKYVNMGDGLYKIYIVSQDGSELIENIIDPFSTITGGLNPSIYKKGLNPDGSPSFKMVDLTKDKKLSTKLLSTKSFVDTEFFSSFESEFVNLNLDLSNTETIDKFNDDQEQVFMGNIYTCLNSLVNNRIQVPRFRFFDLKSENQFTLISDFSCKIPLRYESFEINGVKNTLNINGYIDNGRMIVFNNGTITTYYAGSENNKIVLANPQTMQQQPITQQQMINNAINNNMANGMMQQPMPIIS